MSIKIISIERNEFAGKILITVIWKYKNRQPINNIITDVDLKEEQIITYLKTLIK